MRVLREALRDLEVYYYLGYKLKLSVNAHYKLLFLQKIVKMIE